MITDGKKWHYLALKSVPTGDGYNLPIRSLSRLCRGIILNHELSGFSLNLIGSFDTKKSRHYLYRGRDCVENFCKKLKELGMEIINHQENEMIPLTDKENKFYKKQKICHTCKKEFCTNKDNENQFKYKNVRDQCHYIRKLEELLIVFTI